MRPEKQERLVTAGTGNAQSVFRGLDKIYQPLYLYSSADYQLGEVFSDIIDGNV
jgi:hypothetical protein